ncbi:MAG: glycosyltransferase family A protein [Congregibacter sp.]
MPVKPVERTESELACPGRIVAQDYVMSFVFILPVLHPQKDSVSNYRHVEIALKTTLDSLKQQTYDDIQIIVVCCQVPDWSATAGENVHFLDVSGAEAFAANRNHYRVDIGMKFVLGALYAFEHFQCKLIMRADADDYVDIRVADYCVASMSKQLTNPEIDGYIINKGLQVEVNLSPTEDFGFQRAYLVKRFNLSCGTCRIFKHESLKREILKIDTAILTRSTHWRSEAQRNVVHVPNELSKWLDDTCKADYSADWHPINVLGRHIEQKKHFRFIPLPQLGAAKGCGHGNHVGVLEGRLHEDKIIGRIPVSLFKANFGISGKRAPGLGKLADFLFKLSFHFSRLSKRLTRRRED